MAPRGQVGDLAAALQRQHGWKRVRETRDQMLLRDPATGFQADLLKAVLPEEAASPEEAELAAFFRDAYGRSETRTIGGREMRLQRPEDIITVKVLLGRPKDGLVELRESPLHPTRRTGPSPSRPEGWPLPPPRRSEFVVSSARVPHPSGGMGVWSSKPSGKRVDPETQLPHCTPVQMGDCCRATS